MRSTPPADEWGLREERMEMPRTFFATVLRDPLSDVTRKERVYLLGGSIIGIAIVKTGLVPTQITALGIEFDATNQKTFLFLLGLVVLYFLIAFLVYAASDFLAWVEGYRSALDEIRKPEQDLFTELAIRRDALIQEEGISREEAQKRGIPPEIADRLDVAAPDFARLDRTRKTGVAVATVRALFEYLLPVLVGAYAAYVLIF
jgi:hypothetical protein